jgi:hypothetical protein
MVEPGGETRAITLRLPEAQHEALRTLAFIEKTSINEMVLRAIKGYVAAQHRIEKFEAMLDRARVQYRDLLGREEVAKPRGPIRRGVHKATTAGVRRAKARMGQTAGGYEEQLDELASRARRVRDLTEREEIQRLVDAARAGIRAAAGRLAEAGPDPAPPPPPASSAVESV